MMPARVLVVFALVTAMAGFIWLNPRPQPQVPESARLLKIDGKGRPMGPWKGPWQCVYDTRTGLLWEVKGYSNDVHHARCTLTWFDGETGVAGRGGCFDSDAAYDTLNLIESANGRRLCGLGRWRLPTEEELRTLLYADHEPGAPMLDSSYFPKAPRGSYWTGDKGRALTGLYEYLEEGAVAVDFLTGGSRNMPYRDTTFARLVTRPEQPIRPNPGR